MNHYLIFRRSICLGRDVADAVGPFVTWQHARKWYNELKLSAKVPVPYAEITDKHPLCVVYRARVVTP
jgi:hypothetical protein